MEHKDGGRQGIQRGSSDVTDIDITSVIIKPKLAKWIANLRGLSHSILVRARLCVHTSGFLKSTVTIRFCLWLFFFFSPLSASLHFCPTTSLSQSTQKSNKLLHRHWSFSRPNICIRKKKVSKTRGWVRQRCLFILVARRSNRRWGLDL